VALDPDAPDLSAEFDRAVAAGLTAKPLDRLWDVIGAQEMAHCEDDEDTEELPEGWKLYVEPDLVGEFHVLRA
jgi:hypothetical protein